MVGFACRNKPGTQHMKTSTQNNVGAALSLAGIDNKIETARARARVKRKARLLLVLGVITPREAGVDVPPVSGARDWSRPVVRPPAVVVVVDASERARVAAEFEAGRARVAGLLSAADLGIIYAAAAGERAARIADERAALIASLAAERADARARAAADEAARDVEQRRAAAAGLLSRSELAAMRARASSARLGESYRATDVRARAAGLLRLGVAGRASARGARMARRAADKWLRGNSRREALERREVGAAAGVDDLGAGADWSAECRSISASAYQAAASAAAELLRAVDVMRAGWYSAAAIACPAMAGIRRLSGLAPLAARREVIGRGRWVAGAGLVGRAPLWAWAGTMARRAMERARYGRGGRDGREVCADWAISGDIRTAERIARALCGGADDETLGAAADRGAGVLSRRAGFVAAARATLAESLRDFRAAILRARAAVAAAATPAERAACGGRLGHARRALSGMSGRARVLGRALVGLSVTDPRPGADRRPVPALSDLVSQDVRGGRLTDAGRQTAARMRDGLAAIAARALAGQAPRVAAAAGIVAGDDVAAGDTVGQSSLMQSGRAGADLLQWLAGAGWRS